MKKEIKIEDVKKQIESREKDLNDNIETIQELRETITQINQKLNQLSIESSKIIGAIEDMKDLIGDETPINSKYVKKEEKPKKEGE